MCVSIISFCFIEFDQMEKDTEMMFLSGSLPKSH